MAAFIQLRRAQAGGRLRQRNIKLRMRPGFRHLHALFVAVRLCAVGRRQLYLDLARLAGVIRPHCRTLLQSVDRPTAQNLRDVAEAFGKRPAYFTEYRADYLTAAFAARLAGEPELTVSLYLKMVRA